MGRSDYLRQEIRLLSKSINSKAWLTGRWLWATPILLACFALSQAQQEIASRVDGFISAEMRAQRIPGLSLTVIKNGRVIVSKGYGFANLEHQVPVTPATLFQ